MKARSGWRRMLQFSTKRPLSAADWSDRLLVAHLAILIFGLVAVSSVWHDSALSFSLAFGLKSLVVLAEIYFWLLRHSQVSKALLLVEWVGLGSQRLLSSVAESLLIFIRRASLIVGPPARWVCVFASDEGQKPAQPQCVVRASAFSDFLILIPQEAFDVTC